MATNQNVTEYPPDRRTAKLLGSKYYYPKRECPHGHNSLRFTSNAGCLACLNVSTAKLVDKAKRGEKAPVTCKKCSHVYKGRQCPKCRKAHAKAWSDKNRKKLNKTQSDNVAACREYVRQIKRQPCSDCKKCYPWFVMEFDHKHGRPTRHDISMNRAVCTGSLRRVKAEMKKCELVCANCHKTRTFFRAYKQGKIIF